MDYLVSLLASKGFLDTIVIGLIGGFILKIGSYAYSYLINYLYSSKHFSISGTWVSSFDSYVPERKNIELIRIKQNKEMVTLYLEQYCDARKYIKKFKGEGIFRGAELSSIYYPADEDVIQNGVFVLRVIHSPDNPPNLVGIYTEFSHEEDNGTTIQKGEYHLKRKTIPFLNTLLLFVRGTYFKNYHEIESYISNDNA